MTPSPRRDASGVPVGKVTVPKGAQSTVHRPVRHRFGAGSPRGDGSEAPIGWVAVPKGALAELIKLRCVRFGTPNCWILRFVLLSLIDWRSAFGLTGCYAVLLDRESSGPGCPGCLTSPTSRSNPANPSCQARNNLSTGHALNQQGNHITLPGSP